MRADRPMALAVPVVPETLVRLHASERSNPGSIVNFFLHIVRNSDTPVYSSRYRRQFGRGAAKDLFIAGLFPVNGTYVPVSMQWHLNAGPFTPFTDTGGDDNGEAKVLG